MYSAYLADLREELLEISSSEASVELHTQDRPLVAFLWGHLHVEASAVTVAALAVPPMETARPTAPPLTTSSRSSLSARATWAPPPVPVLGGLALARAASALPPTLALLLVGARGGAGAAATRTPLPTPTSAPTPRFFALPGITLHVNGSLIIIV